MGSCGYEVSLLQDESVVELRCTAQHCVAPLQTCQEGSSYIICSGHTKKTYSSLPLATVSLLMVSAPTVNLGQKILRGNSRNKEFIRFKWCAVVRSVMISQAALLHPAQGMNHPFVQRLHAVYTPFP